MIRPRGSWGGAGLALRLATAAVIPLLAIAAPASAHDSLPESLPPPYRGPGHRGEAIGPDSAGKVLGMSAESVALAAWLPLGLFDGANTAGSDVWGYVAPSGREYAILGMNHGAAFVEVTTPTEPVVIAVVPSVGTIWKEITTHGEFAYVVSDQVGEGMQVIDLTRIDAGVVSLAQTVTADGLSTVHTIRSNEASDYIYLCGANVGAGGLVPYDVSDPAHPVPGPSAWSPEYAPGRTIYVHDVVVRSYAAGPYAGREIAFCCCGPRGLYVVDVTDKRALRTLGSLAYANLEYCHYGWLSDDGRTFYLGDELDESRGRVNSSTTYVIDVADLAAPRLLGSFTNGNSAIDHNLVGAGRFLLQANYRSGLRIFEIDGGGDRTNVAEIGWFDTYPDDDLPNFAGLWGVHWLPSGTILGSDMQRGLFVFDASAALGVGGEGPRFVTGLESPYPNPVRSGATLTFVLRQEEPVRLSIFDLAGRLVETLFDGPASRGYHRVEFDPGKFDLPAGVYFARFEASGRAESRRVVVIR